MQIALVPLLSDNYGYLLHDANSELRRSHRRPL